MHVLLTAAYTGIQPPFPDPGEPGVEAGEQEGDLEDDGEEGQQQRHQLRAREDAVECEEAAVAVNQGVAGGQQETRPPQSGLQHSGNVKNINCNYKLTRFRPQYLNSRHDNEDDTEGRDVMPRMRAAVKPMTPAPR